MSVKAILAALAACLASSGAGASGELVTKNWNHGSRDCATNQDPPVEVYRFDDDTYILRQNKCVHFEAPFIYVLIGEHTIFVQDTGATADPGQFPLYETVRKIVGERKGRVPRILVTHSHSHGDHKAADAQFRGKPGVTLVEPDGQAVRDHFGFTAWPKGSARIDLGGRVLEVVPAPGHQDEAIAVFDPRTGWLLTGDTLYPGRLYVRDWDEYRSSIARLVEFTRTHSISAVLGTHIEISRSGVLFDAGSTYQPGEAPLPLPVEQLFKLNQLLAGAGDEPTEIATPQFVVVPVGPLARIVGSILGWFDSL